MTLDSQKRDGMDQLTPKQVARAIGVNESTIKRWCDLGQFRTVRTAGGHRRLERREVLDFLRASGRTLVDPSSIGLPSLACAAPSTTKLSVHQTKERFRDALIAGDERTAREVVLGLSLDRMSVSAIGDDVIAEAFRDIGMLWDCGTVEVYEERRACEITGSVLRELRGCLPAPAADASRALGATPEGDHYSLAVALAELTLRENGWQATSLGSSVPFESIRAAVAEERPRLLCLSVSHVVDEGQFVAGMGRLFETATAAGTAIAVGGRALDSRVRRRLRYSTFCDTLGHLEQFVAALQGGSMPGAEPRRSFNEEPQP